MKLALLGCDEETLCLLRGTQGEHTLVAAYDTAEFRLQVENLAPSSRLDEDWESLLLGNLADVVIVARGRLDPSLSTGFAADERRSDQLRKLVQAAVPLVVVHPGCEAIVGYELDMIRADSGSQLVPLVPGQNAPAAEHFARLACEDESPLGTVEQIIFERQMRNRRRDEVLAQLARDLSVIRHFLGSIRKLNATAGAAGESVDPLGPRKRSLPPLENLSVHLSGESPFAARWQVMPLEGDSGLKITAIGSRARATLFIPESRESPALLQRPAAGGEKPPMVEIPPVDEFAAALQLASDPTAAGARENAWLPACRDVEVASAVDRSLERGRAVEFFGEEHSEEQSFKGIMAVGGCLMLCVAFVALIVAAAVEGLQLPLRESPYWRAWPLYLLLPIALFLLLQVFQIVARRPEKQT